MPRPKRPPINAPVLHSGLTLVEVAEPWLLDVLFADPAASRLMLQRLSDHVAAVMPGEADALVARLRKLGHTPKVLAE
jgi:hypothetical protein